MQYLTLVNLDGKDIVLAQQEVISLLQEEILIIIKDILCIIVKSLKINHLQLKKDFLEDLGNKVPKFFFITLFYKIVVL